LQEGDPAGPYATLDAAQEAGAVVMAWGALINTIISFLIVAFAVFLFVKWINNLKKQAEEEVVETPAEPEVTPDQELLAEIRDLLKDRPTV
ncbi:MAG: MscL family protein, partial [Bacteroidota bacterium]